MYTKNYLYKISKKEKVPNDWCYIYNFNNPNNPISVSLPAGQGKEFRDNMDGFIKEIKKDTNYRMTIESTEKFFDWCTGADGAKMVLFIILMITKVVLIFSSAKICNYIVGTSI